MAAEPKRERIHLRLDARAKQKIERAAALQQQTVTKFILSSALVSAEKLIEAHKRIVLSDQDWEAFWGALCAPPKPNKKLVSKIRWYQKLTA